MFQTCEFSHMCVFPPAKSPTSSNPTDPRNHGKLCEAAFFFHYDVIWSRIVCFWISFWVTGNTINRTHAGKETLVTKMGSLIKAHSVGDYKQKVDSLSIGLLLFGWQVSNSVWLLLRIFIPYFPCHVICPVLKTLTVISRWWCQWSNIFKVYFHNYCISL